MSARRLRGDGGAVVVEAALVLPILFFLVAGSLDFGNFSLQRSQASSAARDGARYAILHYKCADSDTGACSSSTDRADVRAVALSRAGSQTSPGATAKCYAPGMSTPKSCASAVPDVDYVEVTVTWTTQKLTGIAGPLLPGTVKSTSRMAILGLPVQAGNGTPQPSTTTTTSTTTPSSSSTSTTTSTTTSSSTTTTTAQPECTVDAVRVVPAAGTLARTPNGNMNGQLTADVIYTLTTNGAANCNTGTWTLTTRAGSPSLVGPANGTVSGPSVTFTLKQNDNAKWAAGTYTFDVSQSGTVRKSMTFSVS